MLKKLWTDFVGLRRICGTGVAVRWAGAVAMTLPTCLRTRNLGCADLRMGKGPYTVRLGKVTAKLAGLKVIASIREIWVRDVYRLGDLPSDGVVVDLGANRGYFSAAAAALGNRVVCVEASRSCCAEIRELNQLNGWSTVDVCNVFVGGDTVSQHDQAIVPDHDGVPFISEEELIERHDLRHIDFLKCDIEGSEFALVREGGKLLDMTDRLAMEVHYATGSREEMTRLLEMKGFEVLMLSESSGDCTLSAHKPGKGV